MADSPAQASMAFAEMALTEEFLNMTERFYSVTSFEENFTKIVNEQQLRQLIEKE